MEDSDGGSRTFLHLLSSILFGTNSLRDRRASAVGLQRVLELLAHLADLWQGDGADVALVGVSTDVVLVVALGGVELGQRLERRNDRGLELPGRVHVRDERL